MSGSTGQTPPAPNPAWRRLPLLAVGAVALITGLWGGLARLGFGVPTPLPPMISEHGVLMVCGFLGTLIGVERAVALDRRWAYAAPLLTGLGGLALVASAPAGLGASAILIGSAMFLLVSMRIVVIQPASFTVCMALGAAAWVIGNGLWWAGRPVSGLVWWWATFLLLTIASERLELSRLVHRPRWATGAFVTVCALLLSGILATVWWSVIGARIVGFGMVAMAIWLAAFDIARRTVRLDGLPRYVAICLLLGYAWLFAAGATLSILGQLAAGPLYDAVLHAFFVGFVFSMIFGHAPIIFPAVLGISVRYRASFYLPLVLLHGSLFARTVGDLGGLPEARVWGGALNAAAIVLFIAGIAASAKN
jgi:hypothetical protein